MRLWRASAWIDAIACGRGHPLWTPPPRTETAPPGPGVLPRRADALSNFAPLAPFMQWLTSAHLVPNAARRRELF